MEEKVEEVWNLDHGKEMYPSVTVIDEDGELTLCEITYVNNNLVQLTFTPPCAGVAYLN